jgi:hypothetical protein
MSLPAECIERHNNSLFTLEERNSKVNFENPHRYNIERVRIDGCVIREGERCDYLVNVQSVDLSIFVELKGSDIAKAITQLKATSQKLAEELYSRKIWLVNSTRVPQGTDIPNLKREVKKKYQADLKVKSSTMTEKLE